MTTRSTQALVIGGGPGGYVCAIRLGHLGIKTLLVEKDQIGGTCLNVGCIPSKAVISAAKLAHRIPEGVQMGIRVGEVAVDLGAMMAWKDGIVGKLVGGVGQLLKGNGIEIIRGRAAFRSRREVEVITESGPVSITADHIVIASGSAPIDLPGFKPDGNRVIDSTGALQLKELPSRLIVIGGGYIGLELGVAYAKLGSRVTVVESTPQILPGFDPEIARMLDRRLKKLGVEVHVKATAKGWSEGKGEAIVGIAVDGQAKTLLCEKILITVGRKPLTTGLNLEAAGLRVDEKGFIGVDDKMRTAVDGIYAIGDVAGQPMLAHKASAQGEVAAEVIAGKPAAFDVRCIPAVVFTDPEIATVGLMEHEAAARGRETRIGKFPFAALGRSMTTMETDGFAKILIDAQTDEILGLALIGPNASDLIAQAALAIEMGAVYNDLKLTIHAHPTLSEVIREAAMAAHGEAIHALGAPRTTVKT